MTKFIVKCQEPSSPSQRMLLQRYVYCANAYLYNADADIKTLPRGGAFFCFKKKGGIRNR